MPRPLLQHGRAALVALSLCAGCRAGIEEARFDEWDARCSVWIERASAQKRATAAQPPSDARDRGVQSWDALLQALILARAGGALAYMANDEDSLAGIEHEVEALAARYPELGVGL